MWPNPQETADLVIFTEKILNGKFHFLRSVNHLNQLQRQPYLIVSVSINYTIWSLQQQLGSKKIANDALHKKQSFALRISLVNVTKHAVSY